jgi:hypothetical protein
MPFIPRRNLGEAYITASLSAQQMPSPCGYPAAAAPYSAIE